MELFLSQPPGFTLYFPIPTFGKPESGCAALSCCLGLNHASKNSQRPAMRKLQVQT